jgi:uncharacterized integral membrane protein
MVMKARMEWPEPVLEDMSEPQAKPEPKPPIDRNIPKKSRWKIIVGGLLFFILLLWIIL